MKQPIPGRQEDPGAVCDFPGTGTITVVAIV